MSTLQAVMLGVALGMSGGAMVVVCWLVSRVSELEYRMGIVSRYRS